MLRQVSSRNQRAKGAFKMKNALHVCLLIAICVWLLYQMKHSHDKKRALEERGSNASYRGDEGRFDIRKFGSKNLPRSAEIEEKQGSANADHGVRHDEVEDEEEDEDEIEQDDQKRGQTKEVDALDDREHDEASHKAREISFKGDDASSEVVHIVQEVEHEEASQEARERSFKADDASSAVAHVPLANEAESEGDHGDNVSVVTERRDADIRDAFNRTLEDSAATKPAHIAQGNDSSFAERGTSTMHNRSDLTPTKEDAPSQNMTTVGSKHREERHPDLRIASITNKQTEDAVEFPKNSTSFTRPKIFFQKNSTTVSVEWVAVPANLTAKVDPANVAASEEQATAVHLVHERTNTTEQQTQGGGGQPNLEKKLIEKKLEESSQGSHRASSPATDDNETSGQIESGNSVHRQSKLPDIQNRVDSSEQAAAAT